MILNKIVQAKQAEVARKKHERDLATLQEGIHRAQGPRNFVLALEAEHEVRVIAEIKKASPSKGLLCPNFNPVELAKSYQAGGAAAISVLTDEEFFQGDLKFISAIRAEVELPLLRKDFIIDSYQIYESRAAEADALLLIARLLSTAQLSEYIALTRELGMEALVEVHDERDLQQSLAAGAKIIGINNRDLSDFHTDLQVTVELAGKVPPNCILVSESGIKEPTDLIMLRSHGVKAVLVGEALVRGLDVRGATARLVCGGS